MANRAAVIKAFEALANPDYRRILGFTDEIAYLKDWRTKGRPGSWAPEGWLIHHTGSKGNSLGVCTNGRKGLPGPIVQVHTDRSGRGTVICSGPANHPGQCNEGVVTRITDGIPPKGDAADLRIGDTAGYSARSHLLGIEMDHTGGAREAWGDQLKTGLYIVSVSCYILRWDEDNIGGHREITKRKPDPVYNATFKSMNWFRDQVGINLDKLHGVQTPIPTPAPIAPKPAPAPVPAPKPTPPAAEPVAPTNWELKRFINDLTKRVEALEVK